MNLKQLLLSLNLLFCIVGAAIVGVDYGQEFTKAVLVAPGVPFEVLLTADSKRKDISGLGLKSHPDGYLERLYGSSTLSHCIKSPESCLLHLKQLLGKSIEDPDAVDYISIHSGVSLVATKGKRNTIAFDMAKLGIFPVEEAFAMTLSDIKQRAQAHLKSVLSSGYQIKDIAITVPSFFNQAQRRAVIDAAEIAGFNVVGLIDDGTAVAVNYVSSRAYDNEKQYHVVYDMGAGSTKATLFSVANNQTSGGLLVEIEGIGYDQKLSGERLTKSVLDILAEKFLEKNKSVKSKDFINNPRSMAKLWQAAEKAKMILSANNEASVSVESLYKDIDFRAVVSREEFQEFNSDLMSKVTKPITDALAYPLTAGLDLTIKDIESVILTGGATRTPFVQKHLTALVGDDKIAKNVNADESAALGATLRGVLLSSMFKAKDISVLEHSLSVYEAAIGSTSFPVFSRGSTVGNTVVVELDGITGEDFTIDLYENGQLFQSHVFSDVKNSLSPLNESDSVKYFGTFTLSPSKLFSLDKVQAKSEGKKTVMEKIFGGSSEEDNSEQVPLEGEDSVNATKVEKAPRNRTITLKGKTVHAKQHPMSQVTKQTSIEKLKDLATKDSARKRRDKIRNELESALYDLRSFAETVENEADSTSLLEEAQELVSTYLEWLDYDSDSATAATMKDKLQDVQVLKAKLLAYSEFLSKPLNGEALNALHKKALAAMHDIQDVMLTMAEDASSFRTNFTMIGLDWEAENKKIKVSNLPPLDDKEVQQVFMALNNDLEGLIEKSLVQTDENTEDKTGDYEKDELFAIHQSISSKIFKLEEYKSLLEKAHMQRYNALTKVYRKNFHKKLKEAQAAAAASASSASASSTTPSESPVATGEEFTDRDTMDTEGYNGAEDEQKREQKDEEQVGEDEVNAHDEL